MPISDYRFFKHVDTYVDVTLCIKADGNNCVPLLFHRFLEEFYLVQNEFDVAIFMGNQFLSD